MALRLSPKMSPNAAPATKSHTPTSPNTAPATQNESHDWSAFHMKRHLQCAEQAQSASNLTKYCACHEICKFKISAETPWIASANRKTIRTDSEHDPTMVRPWNRHLAPAASETLLVPSWRRILYEKYNISRSGYLPKCHQMLRLPRKMNLMIDPRLIWNVSYNARSKHSQPPTSPNTAPATKSVSSRFQRKHRELLPPIERRFEQIPSMIRPWSDHEIVISHPPLRRPYSSRLSPKMSPNAAPATKSHTPTSPNTAPATKNAPYSSVGYSLRIFSLLASTLLASIPSRHLFSLGIYPLGISSL